MRYLDQRCKGICDELNRLSVKQTLPVTNWEVKKGNYFHVQDADSAAVRWEVFDTTTMHWQGKDEHYWFKGEVTVPDSMDGKAVWLHIRTQIEELDDAKNPQFLIFKDGIPIQGADMHHRKVKLSDSGIAGQHFRVDLQAYTGILHAEFWLMVDMLEVDPLIEKVYYDLKVPLDAFPMLAEADHPRLEIQTVLNDTINLLDLRVPYSEDFYRSLKKASDYIDEKLYRDLAGYKDVIATCIGHTHIDVAWWWTVDQTREKVGRSFATVLKLMEEYPNYKFMSSQPQLYAFLKERYPELYARVKEMVAAGRWEPEGGMWLEADCNLTSGESLVRQFIYGKRFFREEFGADNRILWLPDVFGYSAALPQIMKKAGIDYFMTTKLAWNQFNMIPNDTFRWQGIDGTQVLAHMITTQDPGQEEGGFFTTYNGRLHPDAIMRGWRRYRNKEINRDILISYGYGDGGGGPTKEMLETSVRMEKGIKGIPKVRQEFAGTYFDELAERVRGHKRLPVWSGELYLEYHRGTYTSVARNKRSNRKSELGLMDLELFAVLSGRDIRKSLEQLWKIVLLNQFHDILPGSSIKEVYEVTRKEYDHVRQEIEANINECVDALDLSDTGVTVFNTLGFERESLVDLGKMSGTALMDETGAEFPIQQAADGSAIAYVKGLPAKGYKTFGVKTERAAADSMLHTEALGVETSFFRIQFDENGLFTSIYDKEYEREVLREGSKGNLLRMYEDKPMNYDNWDIDIFYSEKYWDIDTALQVEWIEQGPVRATLRVERLISRSVFRQDIHFYADSRRIDFVTYVDWKEHQHLLKVHFPVNIHADEASFDIQFGNVKRKIHTNTSWDEARFESCAHKWIDLSEGHYGVSLLNDCKYGHSLQEGDMALTLIKSGIEPNPTTDQEEHYFTYALYPHGEGWQEAETPRLAYDLNQKTYAVPRGTPGTISSLFHTDRRNLMPETVKQAEDGRGIIIRLYEYENALTRGTLIFTRELAGIEECNLLEEPLRELPFQDNRCTVTVKPYEIKTYRVTFINE